MNIYTYFVLGILLGLGIAIYFFMNREEKIEKRIMLDQKIYSTEKLDTTMKMVVERITSKINELKRDLTEEEKNEIIEQCYKKFYIWFLLIVNILGIIIGTIMSNTYYILNLIVKFKIIKSTFGKLKNNC